MEKFKNEIIHCIAFLICFFIISGCDKVPTEPGILEGKISIGPICPVEHDPPDPACLPTAETYKAYPVSIFSSNGRYKIAQLNPALDGSYSIDLGSGKFLVILEPEGTRIGSSNLPVRVEITPGNKTVLDIDIDTGIR